MLVLTRKLNERIVVDNHIVIEVLSIQGGRVRLGITAPPDVSIVRDELLRPDVTLSETDPTLNTVR
jgi:carbon storage regulator